MVPDDAAASSCLVEAGAAVVLEPVVPEVVLLEAVLLEVVLLEPVVVELVVLVDAGWVVVGLAVVVVAVVVVVDAGEAVVVELVVLELAVVELVVVGLVVLVDADAGEETATIRPATRANTVAIRPFDIGPFDLTDLRQGAPINLCGNIRLPPPEAISAGC